MTETVITATRTAGGVRLTVYGHEGNMVIQAELSPRRAALLGLDLLNLSCERVFRADQGREKNPARDGPEPVNPPAVGTPASSEV
jgi:hypothetical protein